MLTLVARRLARKKERFNPMHGVLEAITGWIYLALKERFKNVARQWECSPLK